MMMMMMHIFQVYLHANKDKMQDVQQSTVKLVARKAENRRISIDKQPHHEAPPLAANRGLTQALPHTSLVLFD